MLCRLEQLVDPLTYQLTENKQQCSESIHCYVIYQTNNVKHNAGSNLHVYRFAAGVFNCK